MTATTVSRPNVIEGLKSFTDTLFEPKKPEPSYPVLPAADEKGQSSVAGVYLVGEVAGTPLIKLGLNAGNDMVERLASDIRDESSGEIAPVDLYDFVIIGAGAAGLGAASRAQELGMKAVVIEANHVAETVYTMTKGKILFAEPETVPLKGSMWFEECSKEELLQKWNEQIEAKKLNIHDFEKVTDIRRRNGVLEVESQKATYKARRVILAAGKAGNPRKAGVDGEVQNAARIAHRLLDPDDYQNQRVAIYGGGDVALEAALTLCEHNEVTLVTIDKEFVYPKKRNVDKLTAAAEGKLTIYMDSYLSQVGADSITFNAGAPDGPSTAIGNDFVFEMIGAELPTPFFKKVGIKLEGEWNRNRWLTLMGIFLFVYALYALKKFGLYRHIDTGELLGHKIAAWPFDRLISPEAYDHVIQPIFRLAYLPFSWLFNQQALVDMMADRGFQQGYLYSLLYTIVMAVFGYEALIRWRGIARRKQYQTWRYLSLISFQVAFFFIVNVIASRNHGKRFCTWVCGCGGLAETLGDRWRHMAAKGKRSRAWEFQAVTVFLASVIVGLVVVGIYQSDGNNPWWRTYDYLVDFWLVAVIPIALYPFFGGKVWCRYWCPLAAYNGLLAKWYGKLKIKSNDKCISCTQCSKYCQVGVDVMAFAKNQEPFDNSNSACIQCGICVDVCPMDVLFFTTEDESKVAAKVPA
jgi:thioredoxin reductase/Pyruvate/2-oxoacid:ferredoxin oxidoreductase delta subunit